MGLTSDGQTMACASVQECPPSYRFGRWARTRRRRDRAKTFEVSLAIGHVHAVHGLGVRELITVRGLKLVDQTGPREVPDFRYDLAA